jgi:hypothetical protein
MGIPTSVTTENPEPQRQHGAGSKGTPATAIHDIDAAYYDERPSRGPWLPSEAPPTGVQTWVLGEMAFYYGACWLHRRSAPPRRGKTR